MTPTELQGIATVPWAVHAFHPALVPSCLLLPLTPMHRHAPHWLKSVFKLPSKKPADKDKPRQIDRMLEQLKK